LLDARVQNQDRQLIDLISECIAPADWVQNGGKSSMRIYNGELIISANPRVQQWVESLLDGLRQFTNSRVQK
jgi:hypothetical protein